MKFAVTAIAALIALVQAQDIVEITNAPVNPVAGEPFEITWQYAEGPVTITLRKGDPGSLDVVSEIVSGVDGDDGSYIWNVPDDLVTDDDYALQIDDGVNENYSVQFPLEGTGEAEESETETAAPSTTATTTVDSTSSSEASPTSESTSESASSSSEASSTESESASSTESDSASQTSEDADETDVPDSKAGRLGSPVALIFTLAAMLYFH